MSRRNVATTNCSNKSVEVFAPDCSHGTLFCLLRTSVQRPLLEGTLTDLVKKPLNTLVKGFKDPN